MLLLTHFLPDDGVLGIKNKICLIFSRSICCRVNLFRMVLLQSMRETKQKKKIIHHSRYANLDLYMLGKSFGFHKYHKKP
jgi:hypothetical protein